MNNIELTDRRTDEHGIPRYNIRLNDKIIGYVIHYVEQEIYPFHVVLELNHDNPEYSRLVQGHGQNLKDGIRQAIDRSRIAAKEYLDGITILEEKIFGHEVEVKENPKLKIMDVICQGCGQKTDFSIYGDNLAICDNCGTETIPPLDIIEILKRGENII